MKKVLLFFASVLLFSWQANAQSCASPTALTSGVALTGETTCGTGADLNNNPCNGNYVANNPGTEEAHIYSYTTGATAESITVDYTNISDGWTGVAIVSGTCDDAGATCLGSYYQSGGSADGQAVAASVPAGTTIYVYVSTWPTPNCVGSYDLLLTATPISCANPSALTATNVMATSADLGWTTGGATQWIIEWGAAGFTQGTGTIIDESTATNPYTLPSLTANTSYDFYVRDFCAAGDSSDWVGPFNFATPCVTLTAPYSENFENAGAIPSCWAQGASNAENWLFSNTGAGNHIGNNGTVGGATSSGGYFAWVDDSAPDNTGTTLESPFVDVSGLTVPQLAFYLLSNNEGIANVDFSVDVWDGAAWNVGFYTNNTNTASGEWEQILVDLSTLTITGPVQLKFIVDEPATGDFYDDVAIDDVEIRETPSCLSPSLFTATNVTATSADLGWAANGGESEWAVEYGTSGFAQGAGTLVASTATNPHTVSGLTDNTTYEFYVRAICGIGDSSTWVGPFAFTTPCLAYTLPWLEDFETIVTANDQVPACFTRQNGAPGWGSRTSPARNGIGAQSGTNYMDIQWSQDDWLFTPAMSLTAATSYDFSFGYVHSDASTGFTVSVFYGTAADAASMTTQLGVDIVDPINTTYQDFLETYTVPADGDYYVGIHVVSNGVPWYLNFDDFSLRETPTCLDPSDLTATNITSDGADLGWTDNAGATEWSVEYDTLGFAPGTGTLVASTTTNPHTITGLESDSTYEFYMRSICGAGDSSIWIGPFAFTTLANCPAPSALGAFNVTNNSADIFWTDNAGVAAWDYEWGTTGFAPGAGTTVAATNDTASLAGLTATTGYEFYVRADCGAGQSSWTGPFAFTTSADCGDTLVGLCYSQVSTAEVLLNFTATVGNYAELEFLAGGVETCCDEVLVYDGLNGTGNIIYGALTGGGLADYSGEPNVVSSTGFLSLVVNSDVSATCNTSAYTSFEVVLTCPPPPSCPFPTVLDTANVLGTTVDILWLDNAGAAEWEYEYGEAGFVQGTGTVASATNDTVSLGGLTALTDYEFYVRAVCAVGDSSTWSGPFGFSTTTDCTPLNGGLAAVNNCVAGTYDIEVDIDTLGDAATWFVTDGTDTIGTITSTGVNTFGPFAAYTTTNLFFLHDSDTLCDLGPISLTNAACNDTLCDAIALTVGAAPVEFGNVGATGEVNEPEGSCWTGLGTQNSVWFSFVAPVNGAVSVSTDFAGSSLDDTHIAVYDLPGGDCTDLTDLVELGCSEDDGVVAPSGYTSIADLTGLTAGTTYYVQVDGWDINVGISQIEVTSPCSEPTALMVANETDNSADLSWTSNGGEAEWEVEYGLTGFTPGMGMTAIATTNPYTLTGLDEDSEYEFYVSAICGAGDTSVQSVVDTITTLYLCDDPTMLAVSNITSTSMDVSWMDNAGTGTASIEYGAPGFTPGTGTTVAATTNPATITGLTAEEDYDVYITADCGANGASAAVGPVSATTLESCPAPSGIMTSNVTASSVDVAWTENGPATAWEVEYVATGGAQGSGTVVSATSNPFTVTGLAENTSYDVYVRAICGAGDESDWFGGAGTTFMTGEACPDPSGLLASNITGNTAELSWTENGTATLWSIEYGAPGFTPGTGTTANASSNPFTLNGLAASSDYEFYLTSLCANMIISNQVGPSASFTTSSVDIVDLGNGQTVDVYSYDNTIALTFENVSIPSAQVVVYDIIGQQVANEVVETVGTQTIQLDNVTTGVYLVRLAIDKETNTIKVFLQNN